ncbi:hypothetical protein [Pantoea cypripedii]|uniref:Uncharacterized protein n=1 Tax=Pantoea cypripedii TaxID=55209 RepID=A0A6B9G8N6_PANCY|nr:hypothetical protein [Pantoea cypripedii]QGY29209.1 hypothetical protein CUN67_09820 [Pantoea cypripedii]
METGRVKKMGFNVTATDIDADITLSQRVPVREISNDNVQPISQTIENPYDISSEGSLKKIISLFSELNILHMETQTTPFLSTINLFQQHYESSEAFRALFDKAYQRISHADFTTRKRFAQILHALNDYEKEFNENPLSKEVALFCSMQKIISHGSGLINVGALKGTLTCDDNTIAQVIEDLESRCLDNYLRVETKDHTPETSGVCNSPLDLTLLEINDLIKNYNVENKRVVLLFDFDDTISITSHRFMGISNKEWADRDDDRTAYDKETHIRDVFLSVCEGRTYVGFISSRSFIDGALIKLVDFLFAKDIAGALWHDEPAPEMTINFDGTVDKDITKFPNGDVRSWCYKDKVYLTSRTPKIDIINDIVNKLATQHGVKPSDFFVAFCDDDGGNHDVARNAFKQMKRDGVESYELLSVQTFPYDMVESVYVYRDAVERESDA